MEKNNKFKMAAADRKPAVNPQQVIR